MGKYNFGDDEEYLLKENLLTINNLEDLERAEQFVFTVRALEVEQGKITIENFNLKTLMELHHYLFQDIYRFAGKIRDVQLTKGNTRFCQMQYIQSECNRVFHELSNESEWETVEKAAAKLAYYKSELNMIHPFREGNGRTIRIFIYLLAKTKGFLWDYSKMNREEYLNAMIQSVYDVKPLEKLILANLKKLV